MRIRPLGARALVKVNDAQGKTGGGILLPDVAKDKPQRGKVVAVGPGTLKPFASPEPYYPMHVKVGDEVLVARYANADVGDLDELKGHYMLDERDIICVVEPDEPKAKK